MTTRIGAPVKVLMSVFLVSLLSIPLPLIGAGDDVQAGISVAEEWGDGGVDQDRVLSETEVKALGLNIPEIPSRSEPWNNWERYHYHQGGESGLAVYHSQGNRIFLYGGGSHSWSQQNNYWSHSAYNDFFYFDLATQKWISVSRVLNPGARVSFSYAVDEDNQRFYVYGGYKDGSMANDLWYFDMASMQWTRTSFNGFTLRRSDAPMVIDTTVGTYGKLYVHMGKDDVQNEYNVDNLTGFYSIDLDTPGYTITSLEDGWDPLIKIGLVPRYEHSMCIDESLGMIYLFGGRNKTDIYQRDFWAYSISGNLWTELSVHPEMSLLYGAGLFFRPDDKTVYLFGGRNSTGNSLTVSNFLFGYDTEGGSWQLVDTLDRISGRLLFGGHYSHLADRYAVFAGRYYTTGWGGTTTARYRDLSYLNMATLRWKAFANNVSYSSETNGIFAYEKAKQRLWYVGPNVVSGWGGNGTAYTYYWDIRDRNWKGLFYNSGPDQPRDRNSPGFAYDDANLTVYMYGGGYTSGQWPNYQYHDLADLWKVDLRTRAWTRLYESAGPGELQGFDMVFNPNDGRIYFFGGGFHETTSSSMNASSDLYRFDPIGKSFTKMPPQGTVPAKRYAAGLVMVPEMNGFFMVGGEDPDPLNTKQFREVWFYNIGTNRWTQYGSLSSSKNFPKVDYDPLTMELLVTGGEDSIIQRFRILENRWYTYDPDINPGVMNGNAHYFDTVDRDLWVYGGGATAGIWKIGIPKRLAIQSAEFRDPEAGKDIAFAMYRPYTFSCRIKAVNGPQDLSRITLDLSHKKGSFIMVYNYTEDQLGNPAWTEVDKDDYAELVGTPTIEWNGLFVELVVKVLFHWNFSSKGSPADRTMFIRANGIGVSKDELMVQEFLNVKNLVEITGGLKVRGSKQGNLTEGDWVQAQEVLTFSGPFVRYSGTYGGETFYPPEGTYEISLWEEKNRKWDLDKVPGAPVQISLATKNSSEKDLTYTLNFTGTNPESEVHRMYFNLSVDGELPSAPSFIVLHADYMEDTRVQYDNDLEVYATWQGSREDLSGFKTYYWAFTDGGGTRNGTPMVQTETKMVLEGNGTNTVYIWAEDQVGNIGPAESKSIMIDDLPTTFRILGLDLSEPIPYQTINIDVNLTDAGGSRIISQTVQYRFSNDGQNNVDMWTGPAAWKDVTEIHTNFQKESYQFTLKIGTGKVPRLNDHEENFFQFKCRDGAGSDFESAIYNVKVDTSLRFPMVRLTSPENGTVFRRADDIRLTWETDFFLPLDVKYYLFISPSKVEVETQLRKNMYEVFGTSYDPIWATHGTWYWMVIPEARGVKGNTTNGMHSFVLNNEDNYAFDVGNDTDGELKVQLGKKGIPIEFTVLNNGQETAFIKATFTSIPQVRNISWDGGDKMNSDNELVVNPTESVPIYFSFDVPTDTGVGTYNMTFHFMSRRQISRQVNITLVLTPMDVQEGQNGDEPDPTPFIIGGILAVLVVLLIVGILYLKVIKKKPKSKLMDEQIEQKLDNELVVARDRSFGMAPTPQGLRGQTATRSKVKAGKLEKRPEDEEEEIPEFEESEVEDVMLAEEGSEDEWMNIVAAETVEAETEEDIVESKVAEDSKGKSLQDLLAEMSENVEEEEP